MGQTLGMGLIVEETLNLCYGKASLKSIDTELNFTTTGSRSYICNSVSHLYASAFTKPALFQPSCSQRVKFVSLNT